MQVLQTAGKVVIHQVAATKFNAVRKGGGVNQRGATKQSVEKRNGAGRSGRKTDEKVVTKDKIIKLNNSQQKAIRSLKKQVAEHRQKLKNYIANPDKCDHREFLKNANTSELREKIIQTRVNNLKRQIDTFEKDIDAIKNGLK